MQTITVSIKALYAALAAGIVMMLVILLCIVWLSESRPIVSCASLSFYGINATQFIKDHPQYAKRLDRNHNGIACNKAS